jgi:hypothetical protein
VQAPLISTKASQPSSKSARQILSEVNNALSSRVDKSIYLVQSKDIHVIKTTNARNWQRQNFSPDNPHPLNDPVVTQDAPQIATGP